MVLEDYFKKRKFEKTPEPRGEGVGKGRDRFVVHKHKATRLHYDFRLELPESPKSNFIVLKSWAVPKGPPEVVGEKRLAMQVEDHPVDYLDFQGIIPEGNYGAGKVEIWDKGKFEVKSIKYEENNYKEIKFILYGKRLKGEYILFVVKNLKFKGNAWLILKVK